MEDEHGDVHADDSERIDPVVGPLFAVGSVLVMGDTKLLNLFHSLCCGVVVKCKCPKTLNAHEFCGKKNLIVRIPLKRVFSAKEPSLVVRGSCIVY